MAQEAPIAEASLAEAHVTAELAPSPEALLSELADADFGRKAEIASTLVDVGTPQALQIIDALAAGLLFVAPDKKLYLEDKGVFTDPLSGTVAEGVDATTLEKIGVNNRLRRDLRSLSSRLSLTSPDDAIRAAAAGNAFTSRDIHSLPALNDALALEKSERIKKVMQEARAAILLQDSAAPQPERLAAIETLKLRGGRDALSLMIGASNDPDAQVARQATQAAEHIQSVLSYWSVLQNVIFGLSLGSVLLLAAVGLAITFGVMGVINMAHGEMIMIGAYTAFVVQQILLANAPWLMEWSLPIALPMAFLAAGLAGVLIERFVIRFLYGRPLETLLATWGLSLIIQQAVRTIFGPTNKPVIAPSWMSGSLEIGHLSVTYARFSIILFAFAVLAALMLFLKKTHFGMQMRAVTQNRKMASAMGVRTNWVDALTFGLGSGVAGIAGVALSQIDNVSPNLGQSYIIDSFMVVVFGGVGNLWGTVVGAITLGIANKFLEPYAGAVLGKILVLVFIILFIQRRPRGLFALKGRAVES